MGIGVNLNTNDATLPTATGDLVSSVNLSKEKDIHYQRAKQLTLDKFLQVKDRDKSSSNGNEQQILPVPTFHSKFNIFTSAFNHVGQPGHSTRSPTFVTQNECPKFHEGEPSNYVGQTLTSPMVDPTPVKNMKRQGVTTDEACTFHNVKAWVHTVTKVIGDANDEYKVLLDKNECGTERRRDWWIECKN